MGELEVRVAELKENITQLQLEKTELITKVTTIYVQYVHPYNFIEVNNLIWGLRYCFMWLGDLAFEVVYVY